ncbi:tetratricopeptide repeat-containing sulfotransferase family protein [Hephaestia sp. GCM10023244]|uniref:tetratricopeptide repeat-containing sulfotransferase family protein n=1 Tax=unclassified Hephaestia TaxID=2631281 RepID=UPI002076E7A8|nr:tetratricopeptide repeat-containing sulfotransferase family protein [Hephaestia sp. MAHUQ-44]MCM8730987.1 sulfotransferase [Hephaestia sp. MAHUQ-44]
MIDVPTALAGLKSALDRRDRREVNAAARNLIQAQAPIGSQWRGIAMVLLENGEMADARRAADLLVRAAGGSTVARFVQAAVYARSGRVADAHAMLRSLPDDVPDPLGNAYTRGTLATNVGAIEEAREQLMRAITLAPKSGQSWLALAMLGGMPPETGWLMASLRDTMVDADPGERGAYFFALGKFMEEQREYDDAFHCYAAGAATEAKVRGTDFALADQTGREWKNVAIEKIARFSPPAGRPIFVTGLPRSGTTLVEQILTAHSLVDGGEELNLFRHLIAEIGGDHTKAVARMTPEKSDGLVRLYEHLMAQRFPGQGRVIDKSLLASRYMGLLTGLFPSAPIIWLRRDPLDNAWSMFRTYFRTGLGWTFDLKKIAAQMRLEDALFVHWVRLRPHQILRVDYAELVTAPEQVIPRIVAHCGLNLEAAQLEPHRSVRPVVTASAAQVRQPINETGLGVADPYRHHLQPFIDAYFESAS